jgi:hypothetical protein
MRPLRRGLPGAFAGHRDGGAMMLQDAILDAPTLDRLLLDLEGLAQILEVRRKGGPQAHATSSSIREVAGALRQGQAIQIRYRFDGAEWWDTLMPTPAGVRIVRIQQP